MTQISELVYRLCHATSASPAERLGRGAGPRGSNVFFVLLFV